MRNTTSQLVVGDSRDIGISVSIHNSYPAWYNFSVKKYNSYIDEGIMEKRYAWWSSFLLYRWIIILAFLIGTGGRSSKIQPCITLKRVNMKILVLVFEMSTVIWMKSESCFTMVLMLKHLTAFLLIVTSAIVVVIMTDDLIIQSWF